MIETIGLVSTLVQGYQWLTVWHEQQAIPPYLPENAILLFKRFKQAYDAKDINKLKILISDSYKGDIFGAKSKKAYLDFQSKVFDKVPWFSYLCLNIDIYSIVENTDNSFTAIIHYHANTTVLGLPAFTYDSAPIRCQIKSEDGLWVVTEMFIEHRLI
jgi:hypothetical protein